MPDRGAVRFVYFAGNLGKMSVGTEADGAGDMRTDPFGDRFFDFQREPIRIPNITWA